MPFSWPRLLHILIGVGKAMAYLHSGGVVHRDIASRNILLDGEFNGKLNDFGLYKLLAAGNGYFATHVYPNNRRPMDNAGRCASVWQGGVGSVALETLPGPKGPGGDYCFSVLAVMSPRKALNDSGGGSPPTLSGLANPQPPPESLRALRGDMTASTEKQ
ncbi:PREDICTED: serine/threonine-protein kinase At3g07070-like [Ipomoea nil]|uniref:serine/threonine-protein kinase At3g07070-like n=1 Tax=Ipomoea nil TaxID=35883 RepID=UPI0009011A5B|nr:PREDICTED: serine/threonine-protein kinase At3g07070-like [Ipomoea nil]